MRSNENHFKATIAKATDCADSIDIPAEFESRRYRRREFFNEEQKTDNDPIVIAKKKFKIDVSNVILDTIITYFKTRFNDTTVGVLKALDCITPVTFLCNKDSNAPVETSLNQLGTLCQFYSDDLSPGEIVVLEYNNMHVLLNGWEFEEGDAVPRDAEDLLLFLIKHNLTAQFENIVTLLKLSLTLPVSSAHDERAFSCLKRVKTYLRSTMSEKRLSNLACISVNRERVSSLTLRELQKPFLNKKTRKIFK